MSNPTRFLEKTLMLFASEVHEVDEIIIFMTFMILILRMVWTSQEVVYRLYVCCGSWGLRIERRGERWTLSTVGLPWDPTIPKTLVCFRLQTKKFCTHWRRCEDSSHEMSLKRSGIYDKLKLLSIIISWHGPRQSEQEKRLEWISGMPSVTQLTNWEK